ncbi:MAG: hypothetical protein NTV73_17080 [Hyphomicrobiales bacterium]|nr:hypothetical protein [Hyphomicrobiales bacterium]
MFKFRRRTRAEIDAETLDALFDPAEGGQTISNAYGLLGRTHRYLRTEVATGVNFYSAASGASTLVVGFGTSRGRLSMPLFMVLEALDDTRYDLLLLSDLTKRHFDKGIEGYAATLPELMRRVGEFAARGGYACVVTLGTSMGGFAALRGGDLLAADRAISIGGRFAWHPGALVRDRRRVQAFDPLCHCRGPFRAPFYLLYSRDHPKDPRDAEMLAKIAPASRAIAFPGTHHGVHYRIRQRGRLDAFFAEMLDVQKEPDAQKLVAMLD